MTRSIGVVVDSNSQIQPELAASLGIGVVPIPVMVAGRTYSEGVDLHADQFWALMQPDDAGDFPEVSTSLPSPGDILNHYQSLIESGVSGIVSVHVGEAYSGTANAARLAAKQVSIPVEIIDTGTASYGIACCAVEAALTAETGASLEAVASRARHLADTVRSVFIAQAMEFAAGGRLGSVLPAGSDAIQVIAVGPGLTMEVPGEGRTVDELCELMADTMETGGAPIKAAVGVADPAATPFADGLRERLEARSDVVELSVYRVGPSVGAHFGPGTAGGFWYPA